MKTLVSLLLITLSITTFNPALATVRGYELKIVNNQKKPAKLTLTQYRSHNYTAERPSEFNASLALHSKYIEVPAGKTRTIGFNDATGGYWVRWCQVQSNGNSEKCSTLDLFRDKAEIRLR